MSRLRGPRGASPGGFDCLLERWRLEAASCRRFGAEPTALAVERCAKDLEEWVKARELETLSLVEATTESGLSYSALQRGVREGRIPNAGTPGHPRIRREHVPRKALGRTLREGTPDLLALVASGRRDVTEGADTRLTRPRHVHRG